MNVVIFGATGMVGQGVLRECLLDSGVQSVITVGRSVTGQTYPKLREIVHGNFLDFAPIASQLGNPDACFFCLGVTSVGMAEDAYRVVTHDFTLAAARTLLKLNPAMTFIYVSGMGTDSTERGRVAWARVKGQTENELLQLGFRAAYMFRPGVIVPYDGIVSRTAFYRGFYVVTRPILPALFRLFPKFVTTTRQMGLAMLHAARTGAPKPVLENAHINRL